MITIEKNPNFSEWINIKVFGKLVDNAKTHASAMSRALQIQKAMKQKTSIMVIKNQNPKSLIK